MKGRWHGSPFRDNSIRKWLITFEVDETPSSYDITKDKPLSIDIKEYRKRRSITANSYFYVLTGRIAEALNISKTEAHNRMIAEYGQYDQDLGHVIMKDTVPWMQLETMHLRPTSHVNYIDDVLYRVFLIMRGSHTYDTKEMSILIDGVVSEAKELGIETLPPNELERLKQQWRVS